MRLNEVYRVYSNISLLYNSSLNRLFDKKDEDNEILFFTAKANNSEDLSHTGAYG